MSRELLSIIDQIGREKGIESETIVSAIESALVSAVKKRYGVGENVEVRLDRDSGEIEAVSLKTVVLEVNDSQTQVSLEEARELDELAEEGDEIGSLLEMEDLGRIAAQTAKQVIFQRVREAEWESVHREYSVRVGEIISGMILGQERRNYIVELGKTEALLPISEQIPRESYRRGDRIRAYLSEVRLSSRGPQVILSRGKAEFVAKLFEMEVPEIGEGVVIIKGVVREPGDRTKIAVYSTESSVDPVGACVGVRGSRVQSVVRELRGEKIDIVTWTDDPRTYVGEALSPAVVDKVGVNELEQSALVVVSEQQLSLAIGKKGQNVRLASKLTGWKIDIINQTEYESERAKERDQEISDAISREHDLQKEEQVLEAQRFSEGEEVFDLSDLPGVGEKMADILKAHEISSVTLLAESDEATLSELPLIGSKTALRLIKGAKEHLDFVAKQIGASKSATTENPEALAVAEDIPED
ncbi:MAG: transcription termination/antitermination protein NusA [Nitrospirae bacterium]|nr:transcription termination/antitermination protein NusA [Candidatus Manganitrophaceae bacterium]